jgi:hypothetical protein
MDSMASLRYAQPSEDDPRIGVALELLGYEKSRGLTHETTAGKVRFEFNFDWFVCRLWIEAFGKRLEHPGTRSLDYQELPSFIRWLRESQSGEHVAFETIEPFFRMEVTSRSRPRSMFNVTLRLSAYGIMPRYFYIDSGIAVTFPVTGPRIIAFADELEKELNVLLTKHSKALELWNHYKEAENAKSMKDQELRRKKT